MMLMSLRASSGSSSLAARSSSRLARVSHWPVLVRLPPGSFRLSNRNSPSCLRRAEVELVPDERVDLLLEPRDALREGRGQARQDGAVDLDAGALHLGEDADQRPLQRLVDGRHALGGEARLQHHPQPQRHVGVLGGVLRRLVERHLRERLARTSWRRARARAPASKEMQRVPEVALGELVHAVRAAPAVERVGHQHGVVEGRERRCRAAPARRRRT